MHKKPRKKRSFSAGTLLVQPFRELGYPVSSFRSLSGLFCNVKKRGEIINKQLEIELAEIKSALFSIVQNSQNVLHSNTSKKEDEKLPKPLRHGQGSITKRVRKNKKGGEYIYYQACYIDEFGVR